VAQQIAAEEREQPYVVLHWDVASKVPVIYSCCSSTCARHASCSGARPVQGAPLQRLRGALIGWAGYAMTGQCRLTGSLMPSGSWHMRHMAAGCLVSCCMLFSSMSICR
jgi:hypothetical protein